MINRYIIFSCALVLLAGCALTGNTAIDTEEYRIGVSLPLTGDVASYGVAGQQGIELAVAEINANGGINGVPLRVAFEDDKCSAKEGATAYNKLVNIDGSDAIIGPLCSTAASTAIPIGAEKGVPMLIFGSAPKLTTLSEYEFRLWPSDIFAAAFAAEYFAEQGFMEAAIVSSNDAYGQGLYEEFMRVAPEYGVEVVHASQISSDATDLRAIIQKIIQENPDAVYFAGYPPEALLLSRQSKELGLQAQIFGAELHAEEFYSSPYSVGVQYSTLKLSSSETFQEKYMQKYDEDYHPMAGMAYDAVYVLAEALDRSAKQQTSVTDALYVTSYEGVSNTYAFDETGELLHAAFDVYEVTQEGPLLQ